MKESPPIFSVLDIVAGISPVAAQGIQLSEQAIAIFRTRLAAFRTYDDQRREIATEVAAEDGRVSDINDALELVESDLDYWRRRAVPDPMTGQVCPIATRRIAMLMLRKARLTTLAERWRQP